MPAGFVFTPEHSSIPCVQQGNVRVSCQHFPLSVGQQRSIRLVYRFQSFVGCTNHNELFTARVESPSFFDFTPDDNARTINVAVQCSGGGGGGGDQADLEVVSHAAPVSVQSGETPLFSVQVINNGPTPVSNAVVTHGPIPPGFVFSPGNSSIGCGQQGAFVTCNVALNSLQQRFLVIGYQFGSFPGCANHVESFRASIGSTQITSAPASAPAAGPDSRSWIGRRFASAT